MLGKTDAAQWKYQRSETQDTHCCVIEPNEASEDPEENRSLNYSSIFIEPILLLFFKIYQTIFLFKISDFIMSV